LACPFGLWPAQGNEPPKQEQKGQPTPQIFTIQGCLLDTLETLNSEKIRLNDRCEPELDDEEANANATQQQKHERAREKAKAAMEARHPAWRSRSRLASGANSCSAGDFFRNCLVTLQRDGEVIGQTQTDANGYFEIKLPVDSPDSGNGGNGAEAANSNPKNKKKGPFILSTEADDYTLRREIVITPSTKNPYKIDLALETRPVSLLTRAIVGYDQSGASSAKSSQHLFFDLFVTIPFPFQTNKPCDSAKPRGCIDPNFGPRNRIWADAQVSSVPQSGTATVASLATGAGFAGQVANLQVGQVAQSVQFLIGGEIRLFNPFNFRTLLPSFDHDTKQKFTLSAIGAFGAITPVNPQESVQIYKYQADVGLPAAPSGKATDFIAYVPVSRDRFFRQYYGGVRLQTYFFNRFERPLQRFPGVFDFLYGQNEFITRGHFRGGMFRFDGYWPLPYEQLKYINIFGTFFLRPTRDHDTTPLILEPAPSGTPFPAANVLQTPAPQLNRDYYRIGVGIDFISFAQFLKSVVEKK